MNLVKVVTYRNFVRKLQFFKFLRHVSVFDEIVEKGLSVRQTEALVRKLSTPQEPKRESKASKEQQTEEIHLRKVQQGLEERFGSRVKINQNSAGKGEIVISYSSVGDLNRILELME